MPIAVLRSSLPVAPLLLALACGTASSASTGAVEPRAPGAPVDFAFGTTQGGELSSATTRGRATVLLFVTTYDPASQLAAQRLDKLVRHLRPRVNAGAVVLEPPKYAVLADVFRTTLDLSFPVAIADDATREGDGAFGKINVVPAVVVLDRYGRVRWTRSGVTPTHDIEQALAAASRTGFPSTRQEATP